jgi:hypothetical protein
MTNPREDESAEEKPLSRRDWIVLPALSLLTIIAIVCAVEGAARLIYTESETTTMKCLIVDDPATGVRAVPNTACTQKIFESELTTYEINSCGHRAGMSCGPKSDGTYRIVMIGSSFNYGMWVPQDQSFAALLPRELSLLTGRKVELYNEAMQWGFPRSVTLRFNEVLAAKPDMIFWPLTPMDIESVDQTLPYIPPGKNVIGEAPNEIDGAAGRLRRLITAVGAKSPSELLRAVWNRITSSLDKTRSVFLLQHLLFQSQSLYVDRYLMRGESSDYLRDMPTEFWRENLKKFERYYAEVQMQANEVGAAVVVVMLPARAQAAMISMNEWPAGFDPYKLDDEVRTIVLNHGGTYIDILGDFRAVPNPERRYLPVDGHPDAGWHASVSGMLAKALTSGSVPSLEEAGAR